MKVARLSDLPTGCLYPQGHSAARRFMWMKNSSDTIRNWSHDLPVCSAVPQPLHHHMPILRVLKKFEMCGISCHIIHHIFTRHSRSLYLMHKKWKLRVFGAWHHKWKFWGQNHDIYSHYTSTAIYTLCRYKVFVALPVKFSCHFYFQ
jgi:hypothetical protein